MSKNDIKLFIDFFHNSCIKIRKIKPAFQRGMDGMLVKKSLETFSREQLDMLAVWFLANKPKLQPKIGTMFSKKVMEELERKIKEPNFWKDLDVIFEKYYPRQIWLDELKNKDDSFKGK